VVTREEFVARMTAAVGLPPAGARSAADAAVRGGEGYRAIQ
jgi:hypothetical protein